LKDEKIEDLLVKKNKILFDFEKVKLRKGVLGSKKA